MKIYRVSNINYNIQDEYARIYDPDFNDLSNDYALEETDVNEPSKDPYDLADDPYDLLDDPRHLKDGEISYTPEISKKISQLASSLQNHNLTIEQKEKIREEIRRLIGLRTKIYNELK